MKPKMRKFRLFRYNLQCSLRGYVIDLTMAIQRGLVKTDSKDRVLKVSDDLQDLGLRSELGHRRNDLHAATNYFGI